MQSFKIYSLSNFQIYNSTLLSLMIMRYITASELKCLILGSEYLLQSSPISHIPRPCLWQPLIYSVPMSSVFFKIPNISDIIQYLSFSVWLNSLNVPMIHLCCSKWHEFLSFLWLIVHYKYISVFLSVNVLVIH